MCDFGRLDMVIRRGWTRIYAWHRLVPVVSQETMSFRQSLTLWQRYDLQTRLAGDDEHRRFVEHRIVINGDPATPGSGEVAAVALMRLRFLRQGRAIDPAKVRRLLGQNESEATLSLPDWAPTWAAGSRLPAQRTSFTDTSTPFWG